MRTSHCARCETVFGNAAQHAAAHPLVADDDEVGANPVCHLEDRLGGLLAAHVLLHLEVGGAVLFEQPIEDDVGLEVGARPRAGPRRRSPGGAEDRAR